MIIGAWHIARIGEHWREIAESQLQELEKSKLLETTDWILVTLAGFDGWPVPELLNRSHRFRLVGKTRLEDDVYPLFVAIEKSAQQNKNSSIWFIHGKGATTGTFNPPNAVDYWREYMMYFTVDKWKDNLKALDNCDLCGVEWRPNTYSNGGHLSGGFFWMTSQYINQKCEPLEQYVNVIWKNNCHRCGGVCKAVEAHKRSALEFWIGHANPKVYCPHNFNQDLYHFCAYPNLYGKHSGMV